jgi:hypothetical protein
LDNKPDNVGATNRTPDTDAATKTFMTSYRESLQSMHGIQGEAIAHARVNEMIHDGNTALRQSDHGPGRPPGSGVNGPEALQAADRSRSPASPTPTPPGTVRPPGELPPITVPPPRVDPPGTVRPPGDHRTPTPAPPPSAPPRDHPPTPPKDHPTPTPAPPPSAPPRDHPPTPPKDHPTPTPAPPPRDHPPTPPGTGRPQPPVAPRR